MTANLSPKALANNAEDSFKKGKPPVVLQLENKAPGEGKLDSTKFISMGNGVYAIFPNAARLSQIIRVPAVKESTPPGFFRSDPVGLQLIRADSYFSTGTGTRTYQNGQEISSTFSASGPLDTVAAYRNRVEIYPSFGVTYTFPADFSNYPPYAPIKANKEKFYFVMNMPNSPTIAQEIRAFLASKGELPAIYNASMLIHTGLSGQNSKWFIAIWADYDINGNITFARGDPALMLSGFDDADILPGAVNWAYTCTGMMGPNNVIYNNGNGNYKLGLVRATSGAFNEQRSPTKTGFIAQEVVEIRPISTKIPSAYSLSQNFPNPFNAQTKIGFAVKKAGNVSIKVYDMLGREVATLVNSVMPPGTYEANWNAPNLSSGIYSYRMQTGDFGDAKKLALVK